MEVSAAGEASASRLRGECALSPLLRGVPEIALEPTGGAFRIATEERLGPGRQASLSGMRGSSLAPGGFGTYPLTPPAVKRWEKGIMKKNRVQRHLNNQGDAR